MGWVDEASVLGWLGGGGVRVIGYLTPLFALCLFIIPRLRSRLPLTFIHFLFSWAIFIAFSPLLAANLTVLMSARFLLSLCLRLWSGGRVSLVHPLDAPWVYEKPASTSTCVALYVMEGKADMDKVRAHFLSRVLHRKEADGRRTYDCLWRSLRTICGFACWERQEELNFVWHIDYFACRSTSRRDPKAVWTEEDVFEELSALQDVSLNVAGHPPWELLLIPRFHYTYGQKAAEHYVLVARMHHALMDGVSVGQLMYHLADRPFAFTVEPTKPIHTRRLLLAISYALAALYFPPNLMNNLWEAWKDRNRFPAQTLSGPKTFRWSRLFRMTTIKELKNRSGTSFFAVLLSCLGGAMQKLCERKEIRVPDLIHGVPPVAMLPYPDRRPRNRFSFVLHPVRVGADSSIDRLRKVQTDCVRMSSSHQVLQNLVHIYCLGLMPTFCLEGVCWFWHNTLAFSNTPGAKEKVLAMSGDTVLESQFWVPIKNMTGIGMASLSHEDRLRMTFVTDGSIISDSEEVDFLRDAFEMELSQLAETFGITSHELFISPNCRPRPN